MNAPDADLARLAALRDRLEAALADEPGPRDLPALSREYRTLLAHMRELHTPEETDVVDQLAKRRDAKGSASA